MGWTFPYMLVTIPICLILLQDRCYIGGPRLPLPPAVDAPSDFRAPGASGALRSAAVRQEIGPAGSAAEVLPGGRNPFPGRFRSLPDLHDPDADLIAIEPSGGFDLTVGSTQQTSAGDCWACTILANAHNWMQLLN